MEYAKGDTKAPGMIITCFVSGGHIGRASDNQQAATESIKTWKKNVLQAGGSQVGRDYIKRGF